MWCVGCGVSGKACPECFTLGHAWGRTGAWAARVLERGGESRAWSKEMGSSVGESKGEHGHSTHLGGGERVVFMENAQTPSSTLYALRSESTLKRGIHAPRSTPHAPSSESSARKESEQSQESQENKSGILGNYVKIKSRRGLHVIFSNVGKAEKMT